LIGIINYGLGNVRAFENILKKLNISFKTISYPNEIKGISKAILPGVGSFDSAINKIKKNDIFDKIDECVKSGMPVLGVCVGMQIMFSGSEEGDLGGFDWINAKISKLNEAYPLPHLGWNNISFNDNELFKNIDNNAEFFFLHSYGLLNSTEFSIATTEYFQKFSCAVQKGNIFGVQFHPEKSHDNGIILLNNFCNL